MSALAILKSRALDGFSAPEVIVEVHLSAGLPGFALVGLPDTEVKEARDRVRAALLNSGFDFPRWRITVNLAPADLPKESGRFDLPIALGILAASGQIPVAVLSGYEFAGELSLSGEIRSIRGALAMALAATGHTLILPRLSAAEAVWADTVSVLAADHLLAVVAHLMGRESLSPPLLTAEPARAERHDMSDVRGQAYAKRALEISAAGRHSLLFSGPPGSGKSMLAARLPGILPPLSRDESLASAALLSLAGEFRSDRFGEPSFRSPHHTASAAALVGGGTVPRPGEISLAHHGVLFLDELPEFDRRVLEALREPLENGHIHIARAARRSEFPARFQLIAAMNPCPCGYHGDCSGRCRCTPDQVLRYRSRLSGPLLDRIDLMVEVPAVEVNQLNRLATGETSAQVRERVVHARNRQQKRQGKANAHLLAGEIETNCIVEPAAQTLLEKAVERLDLSVRAYHRALRVARTIADLVHEDAIGVSHMAEAIQYRRWN